MTADYNEGKRAAYVPPVRLYLFVSVLFFDLPRHLTARRDERAGNASAPVGAEPVV